MAVGALAIGLTLTSLGLSAYSQKVQLENMERQAKLQGMARDVNVSKYKADLATQQTGLLEEAKMALNQIEAQDARKNVGANTATQSLVQGVMGDVEASSKNIARNVRDMEFNNKMAGLNEQMGVANARRQSGLNFLGQAIGTGASLYGSHKEDQRLTKIESQLAEVTKEQKSSIQSIMDNMKF